MGSLQSAVSPLVLQPAILHRMAMLNGPRLAQRLWGHAKVGQLYLISGSLQLISDVVLYPFHSILGAHLFFRRAAVRRGHSRG